MPTDVVAVLREQLAEAQDQVRRLTTAIAALAGAGLRDDTGRRRPRNARSSAETGTGRKRTGGPQTAAPNATLAGNGRKKRTFSAEARAKIAAAQKARWAKRKEAAK